MKPSFLALFPGEFLELGAHLKPSEFRIFLVLAHFVRYGNRGDLTIHDLERGTGLSKTVLYRRLKSLQDQRLLRWKSGDWMLSPWICFKGRLACRVSAVEDFEQDLATSRPRDRSLDAIAARTKGQGKRPSLPASGNR